MEGENKKKKYDYGKFVQIHIANVPKQMKATLEQDRKQKGIPESTLIKNIIGDHYQKNPLIINPHFLDED